MTRKIPLMRLGVMLGLGAIVAVLIAWDQGGPPVARAHHTPEELASFAADRGGLGLPVGQNNYFMASGNCEGCHGHDPMQYASVDSNGVDVNVVDDWRSTLMANSAHDPFWRAKVSHEGLVNPALQSELEDKCTSCHAPMGRHDKYLSGGGHYSIAELEQDPIGLDGVSCVGCHIQSPDSLGLLFSGDLRFDTQGSPLYGPYGYPNDTIPLFGAPMTSFVGYEPQYGAHINSATLCAGCHTLMTPTVDLQGNPTGGFFAEQATYHEWLNSRFNDLNGDPNGISCQGCHVPRNDDAVVISALYLFLQRRFPFGMHQFAGANSFMLGLLKDNIGPLGLTANETQFDSTIARTLRMLQDQSLLMDATVMDRTADTAFIDVSLLNLAGHKFPSGYPSRRAFMELIVLDATGTDTLFRSGGFDDTYEVVGHDADWEPHYDVITSADQAQIYEHVIGDVNGDRTTVLLRAAQNLKDNRLVPEGFTAGHFAYDTCAVAGVPSSDVDFNRDAFGVEGNGGDIVHYHVPMGGYTGLINVVARFWYQTAPARWTQELFSHSSAAIDSFEVMYNNADRKPVLVKEVQLTDFSVGIDGLPELGVRVFPNPVHDGVIRITGIDARVREVVVYDVEGRVVARPRIVPGPLSIPLHGRPGTYLVAIRTEDRSFVERVVLQ